MSKPIVFAVAVVASLAVTPAFAGAKPHAKSHRMKFSGVIDNLSSTGTIGVPGTIDTDSGILDGTVSGRSVGRAAFYQTATWGPGLTLVGHGRIFNLLGSIKFKATSTFTVNPDKTESYTGKGTVTGGTGLYKDAHGATKLAGTSLGADSDAATISLTGKITY